MKKILTISIICSLFLSSCWIQTRNIFDEKIRTSFIKKDISSPFYGNSNSKVQITIFTDFQCPACIRFEETIGKKLYTDYVLTNKIGLTYKNFPLNIHINAPEDALASMCSHEQWKFLEFANKIYSLEKEKNWLLIKNEERENIASQIWLNIKNFSECVENWYYVDKIIQDMSDWEKIWLQWTPSVYANWKLINFDSEENFFKIINQLLQ